MVYNHFVNKKKSLLNFKINLFLNTFPIIFLTSIYPKVIWFHGGASWNIYRHLEVEIQHVNIDYLMIEIYQQLLKLLFLFLIVHPFFQLHLMIVELYRFDHHIFDQHSIAKVSRSFCWYVWTSIKCKTRWPNKKAKYIRSCYFLYRQIHIFYMACWTITTFTSWKMITRFLFTLILLPNKEKWIGNFDCKLFLTSLSV